MFEAHPFLTLIGVLVFVVIIGAGTDMEQNLFGTLFALCILVWSIWAISIPDTPEEAAAKQVEKIRKEEIEKQKAIPKVLSEADGCTVYVFERQGREHFFTRCPATTSTETNWTEGCGKGCSRPMHDSIITPNTRGEK